uniref:Ribosomal protein S13/S15 N-terminal domain-containing protein n=1 Tax=Meloidogyne javanica TaxID=6303 RepID=A0A915MIW5_MELJA
MMAPQIFGFYSMGRIGVFVQFDELELALQTRMGRMHNPGKGISRSALPYRRSVPTWQKLTSQDVEEQIVKLARKGLRPSQIGVILRDS